MTMRRQRGFNLVELMLAISILAVLLGLGIPSMTAMVRDNRVAGNTNELVVALSVARSEAVRRGLPVAVCASTTGTSCAGAAVANWATGWIVFTDSSGAVGVVNGPTDEVLQRFDAASQGVLMTSNNLGFVRFLASGLPPIGAPVDTTFTIRHTTCAGNNLRTVRITRTGRLNTTKGACP